jgi:hypothetical protein
MLVLYLIAAASAAYWAASIWSRLQANIAEAKRSGLPYVISPFSPTHFISYALYELWDPIVRLLPKSWWQDWIE